MTGDGPAGAAPDGVPPLDSVRTPRPRRRRRAVRPGAGGDEPSGTPVDEGHSAWGEVAQDSDGWLRDQRPPHHGD